jgi:hypothetical protein
VEHPVDFQVVVGARIVLLCFLHEHCKRSLWTCCSGEILIGDGSMGVVPRKCQGEPSRAYRMGGGGHVGGVCIAGMGAQK